MSLTGNTESLMAANTTEISSIIEITNETKYKEAINAKGLVLVDFYATWCGPCKRMVPIFEQAAKDNKGKLQIIKVDVDKLGNLAANYKIQSIPTMLLFKDGKMVWRQTGAIPYEELKAAIDKQK